MRRAAKLLHRLLALFRRRPSDGFALGWTLALAPCPCGCGKVAPRPCWLIRRGKYKPAAVPLSKRGPLPKIGFAN